ncbi:MAG: hypothetical protein M1608_04635 [Candidatus Omnitrophica bacterium]|nr:hypothetical protein [Candidatus Omnitrophota bacterium]
MKKYWAGIAFIALSVSLGFLAWKHSGTPNTQPAPKPKIDLDRLFDEKLSPIIDETTFQNRAAVERAINEVEALFSGYAAGAPGFAEDITSWSSRFAILKRGASDYWNNEKQVEAYVRDKFNNHILSEKGLESDLDRVLKGFATDLEANRNTMLARIDLELKTRELPISVTRARTAEFQESLRAATRPMPSDSIAIGFASFGAGIAVDEAVKVVLRQVLGQIAARITATAAAEGIVAAGETGAAGIGGAGAGTAIEPGGGTVIGLVIGFTAGAAIDWWMTNQLREKISERTLRFLAVTKKLILEGDNGKPGLKEAMNQGVTLFDRAMRISIRNALIKEP